MFPQQQSVNQQRKIHGGSVASQNETQAKEKLAGYVYEYLVHSGAQKTAEMFKNEILAQQNLSQISPGEAPGFLHNWWCVFWDLYSAAPERRDKYDPSQEAKAFHEYGLIPSSNYAPTGPGALLNGIHPVSQFGNGGQALPPMGMPPNGDGIVPGYFARGGSQPGPSIPSNQASPIAGPRYSGGGHPGGAIGARSGAPTPSNIIGAGPGPAGSVNFPPGAQPPMFNEQMRNLANAQRMNSNARIPNFPPGSAAIRHMRPGQFAGGQHQFIESPSGTSPFPQNTGNGNGMLPNGMCSTSVSLMSSPGHGGAGSVGPPPTNPDGSGNPQHDPRYMMNMPGQFAMNHHEGQGMSGTPTSCSTGGNSASGGFNNMQMNNNNTPMDNSNNPSGAQLQNLLNGSAGGPDGSNSGLDMKQSPISHINGSTPGGPHTNPGSIQQQAGPSSVHGCHGGDPGSVQSQPGAGGAPGSVLAHGPNSQQPHMTPTSDTPSASMDFQPTHNATGDEATEISKIKASLIEDFSYGNHPHQ